MYIVYVPCAIMCDLTVKLSTLLTHKQVYRYLSSKYCLSGDCDVFDGLSELVACICSLRCMAVWCSFPTGCVKALQLPAEFP